MEEKDITTEVVAEGPGEMLDAPTGGKRLKLNYPKTCKVGLAFAGICLLKHQKQIRILHLCWSVFWYN